MPFASIQKLETVFNLIKDSAVENIRGCYSFDSGKKGPCVGIAIMTHGNEPSGLANFEYFLTHEILPIKGRIIFVINNIRATKNFFKATSDEEKKVCRKIDENFNRLPKDCLTSNEISYEIQRAKELHPIYKKFNFGLDTHSTTATALPFIIDVNGALEYCLCSGFPSEMNTVITNITAIQKGIPVCYLFGDGAENVQSLVIETGRHNDNGPYFQRAIDCALAFCTNCGVLQSRVEKITKILKCLKS